MTQFTEQWVQEYMRARGTTSLKHPTSASSPRTPGHITERDVTRQIRDVLKYHGIFHWKVMQGLGSTPGIADILGIFKGKMLAIEVKAPNGRLSDHQKRFLDRVTAEGGIAIVAYSVEAVIGQLGLELPMFGGQNAHRR